MPGRRRLTRRRAIHSLDQPGTGGTLGQRLGARDALVRDDLDQLQALRQGVGADSLPLCF